MNTYDVWGTRNDNWIWIVKIIKGTYVPIMAVKAENWRTAYQIVDALESMD